MTATEAFLKGGKEMIAAFTDAGWTDGDMATQCDPSKHYFFHYHVRNDYVTKYIDSIKNLYSVWGANTVNGGDQSDDEYASREVTIFVNFYMQDPVTDEKVNASLGALETAMASREWAMSITSADIYDDSNKLRGIEVSFKKMINDERTY